MSEASKQTQVSKFRTVFNMMLSPGTAIKKAVSGVPFYFSMLVSGTAFGLFFLQTGLDMYRTGRQPLLFVITAAIAGALFGITAVPAISAILWAVSKPFGCSKSLTWAIKAFCLSYSGALVYCVIGIIISVFFGWRTAVAFGVTGVMWAVGPMIATIKEMIGGKVLLCVMLAALAGSSVLLCWSFLGKI
ncbi:MAG: hypothetical protein N2489_01565 [Clostridia bacterium]|nr:hypothetical protein [Clostridia bacterium]